VALGSGCSVDRQGQTCGSLRPSGGLDRSRWRERSDECCGQAGRGQAQEKNSEALAKHDYMAAVLTGFRLDLDNGEEERVLLGAEDETHLGHSRRTWGFDFS